MTAAPLRAKIALPVTSMCLAAKGLGSQGADMKHNKSRAYTQAELMSDAFVHVAGLAAVAGAVPVLIVLAAILRGDAPAVVGASTDIPQVACCLR